MMWWFFCVQSVADKSSDGFLPFRWQWCFHGWISRPRETWLTAIITIFRSAWRTQTSAKMCVLICWHYIAESWLIIVNYCYPIDSALRSWKIEAQQGNGPKGFWIEIDTRVWLICPWVMPHPSKKFHQILFVTFCVIWRADRQTPVKT